jgi:hypothetical protein
VGSSARYTDHGGARFLGARPAPVAVARAKIYAYENSASDVTPVQASTDA